MTKRHSLSIRLIWIKPRYSFGRNKPKEQNEKNVIFGEQRSKNVNDKVRAREVTIVGTPRLGYPFLLCLGKSLVVILDYALAT